MAHDIGTVGGVDPDRQVTAAERLLNERRRGALAMIAIRSQSWVPSASAALDYWRGVLAGIDREASQLAERMPERADSHPDHLLPAPDIQPDADWQ